MAYRIVSADGLSAAADSDVIHPHVRDESLCEGDARSAIVAALRSGRLFDFFEIVVQTLATYNAHSAFVTLDRWQGISCSDCGRSVDEDEQSSCEGCECEICHDCAGSCEGCDRWLCNGCLGTCAGCQASHCSTCLTECSGCSQRFCERCQTNELCTDCCENEAGADQTADDVQACESPTWPDALRLGQVGQLT